MWQEKLFLWCISNKFEISFPLRFTLLMKIITMLPWPIYKWLMLKKIKK